MCHDEGSSPPAPPSASGQVAERGELTLVAADGNEVHCYYAKPDQPSRAGVVLLPDMRGVHDFYREFADRLAETGLTALEIDYYGRSAPKPPRGADFNGMEHLMRYTPEHSSADIRAAVDALVGGALGATGPVFTLGFCVGGSFSWGQAALDDRLAGVIGLYGRPSDIQDLVPRMRAPLLALTAGADFLTPAEANLAFDAALSAAGVEHEFALYEGAPHAFFDGGMPGQEAACADAWQRLLTFIERHSSIERHSGPGKGDA